MRRVALATTIGAAAWIVTACHTITEELPNKPSSVNVTGGQIPVVIVPVPVPVTQAPAPAAPAPEATPRPGPAPAPAPTAVPGGEPNAGNNTSPVARVACGVYFVECNGQVVEGRNATSAGVGCRVHLDVTAKDAGGDLTYGKNPPDWIFSNPGMIERTSNAWNPTITAKGAHHQDMYAQVDGVRCNSFGVTFQ